LRKREWLAGEVHFNKEGPAMMTEPPITGHEETGDLCPEVQPEGMNTSFRVEAGLEIYKTLYSYPGSLHIRELM
jgi:hypothetical protein